MISCQSSRKGYAVELFVLSAVSLYLELFLIRWLSGDVRLFTVFRTFPLITCFIGLGLGCALARNSWFRWSPLALLATVFLVKVAAFTGMRMWMFPSAGIYFWQDLNAVGLTSYVLGCIPLIVLMLSGPFALMACVGARLGVLFKQLEPLPAYSINVGGALAGSIAFAAVSLCGWHPWALIAPAAVLIGWILVKDKVSLVHGLLPLAGALAISYFPVEKANVATFWSPYQHLTMCRLQDEVASSWVDFSNPAIWNTQIPAEKQSVVDLIGRCLYIRTNLYPYQSADDLSAAAVKTANLSKPISVLFNQQERHYGLPYKLKSAQDVLVVGSGTGNDVASALRHGVKHVDAVELDPVIAELGKRLHPERPYDSPRVTLINDDARHFFNQCNKRYDLVIFAGLDSQTVVGQGSSVRVDTYVHTKESVAKALSLLKPDGLVILTFICPVEWLPQRIFATVRQAAGYDPLVLKDCGPVYVNYWQSFVAGPAIAGGSFKLPADVEPFRARQMSVPRDERIVTDDWPYLYVTPVKLDGPYCMVLLAILAICLRFARPVLFTGNQPKYWSMFFLGAAFLLLELKSIAQMSLLFGSTWLSSAIVIDGILVMILLANLAASRLISVKGLRQEILYALLAVSLVVNYLIPADTLLTLSQSMPFHLGDVLATLTCVLPLFVAGLIFAVSFARVSDPGRALAFNLFGSVVGGLTEYVSIYTGVRGLELVALGFYVLSYIAYARNHDPDASLPQVVAPSEIAEALPAAGR